MLEPVLLESFLAVAQARNFSEAGRRLGLRQSTISQHIRKLEDAAGRRLFVRDTHSVMPTADGEAMEDFARSILEANERARRYFAGSQLRGRVRFGASDDFVASRLPEVLADFVRLHPLVDLALSVEMSATLYQMLDAGELDVVLCKRRPGDERGRLVWRDRLAWIGTDATRIDPDAAFAADPVHTAQPHPRHGARNIGAGREAVADRVLERQPERTARRRAGGSRRHGARAWVDARGTFGDAAGLPASRSGGRRVRGAGRHTAGARAGGGAFGGDPRQWRTAATAAVAALSDGEGLVTEGLHGGTQCGLLSACRGSCGAAVVDAVADCRGRSADA